MRPRIVGRVGNPSPDARIRPSQDGLPTRPTRERRIRNRHKLLFLRSDHTRKGRGMRKQPVFAHVSFRAAGRVEQRQAPRRTHPDVGIGSYAYAQCMRPPVREEPNSRILPILGPSRWAANTPSMGRSSRLMSRRGNKVQAAWWTRPHRMAPAVTIARYVSRLPINWGGHSSGLPRVFRSRSRGCGRGRSSGR